jgi:hypothetical protein
VHAGGYAISIDCDLLRSLPNAKFSEVTHAESFITPGRRPSSFNRADQQKSDNG